MLQSLHHFAAALRRCAVVSRAATFVACVALVHAAATAQSIEAIEYYNTPLDHYFITAYAAEIAKLDAGDFAGWARTGYRIRVHPSGSGLAGVFPVCRFYGRPEAGLDSHFYSASASECGEVVQKFPDAWVLEASDVFGLALPDLMTGQCPAGTVPVYRAWNGRQDSNHRYTTDPSVQASMIAKGYIAEGYGPPTAPVAMCAPNPVPVAPLCTLSASNTSPNIGTNITLTANCTANPTSYTWTGCASTTSTCIATSSVAGTVLYSVVATNAAGNSAPASVSVTWTTAPPPPSTVPACVLNVTANHLPPVVGDLVLITAACSNSPTSYTWSGPCGANGSRCYAFVIGPITNTYTLVATNTSGPSPPVSVSLAWQASAPPAPGMCGTFPSALYTDLGYRTTQLFSAQYTEDPAFAWNGAWTIKFAIPSVVNSTASGRVIMSEFAGPPTPREITLSSVACDFRPTDPTGVNGPVARASSSAPGIFFAVAQPIFGQPRLLPGQTYYMNARNWSVNTGTISCAPSPGRCDAQIELQLPR